MKKLLTQISLLIVIALLKFTEAIQTFYNETFILPQYTYIEFLRSSVKLLESEYEPGSISAFLYLTKLQSSQDPSVQSKKQAGIQLLEENKNKISDNSPSIIKAQEDGPTDPSKLNTYDLLLFSDPNNQQFKNYIKAMQNQQWEVQEFKNDCPDCSSCLFPVANGGQTFYQLNLTGFSDMMCCKGCSTDNILMMNILGQKDSVQFNSFDSISDSPMIIIIDNTPFPDGNSNDLADIYFSSQYKITITPNEQYFTATVVLCIVFGGILLIGTVVILSMNRQYQQAKVEEVTRNLVNPENKYPSKKKQN